MLINLPRRYKLYGRCLCLQFRIGRVLLLPTRSTVSFDISRRCEDLCLRSDNDIENVGCGRFLVQEVVITTYRMRVKYCVITMALVGSPPATSKRLY